MKKPTRLLTAAVLAAALFTLAAAPVPAHAQSVSPYPAPTIITTAPYTINAPGYYQLGANLTVTTPGSIILTINAGNVTLDFAGHFISGPNDLSGSVTGIVASNRGNIIVRNGTVAYCGIGIDLYSDFSTGSSSNNNINNTVDNMLVSRCSFTGIQISNATGATVSNNRITFTGGNPGSNYTAGLYFSSNGAEIINNVINTVSGTGNSAAYGMIVSSTANVTNNSISNVTVASASKAAIGINGSLFALGNKINNCKTGISGAIKYKDNLTYECTTAFQGGTPVGTNN